MAYNIKLTNGQTLVTIPDGSIDTSYSSIYLFGKNCADYGDKQVTNFVHILENFSYATPPTNPLQGQVWYDSANKRLNVRTDTQWKVVSGPTAAATAPASPIVGDLWWDTANTQLKSYNGTDWTLLGPMYSSTQLMSGPVVSTIVGTDGIARNSVLHYVSNVLVAVFSKEPLYAVNTLPGFTQIGPGINLPSGNRYYGDANNAISLGGVLAANYLRGDVASTALQPLTIQNNGGLTIGANNNATLSYNSADAVTRIDANVDGQSLSIRTNRAGVMVEAFRVDGPSGKVSVTEQPTTDNHVVTKTYVDTLTDQMNTVLASKSYVETAITNNNAVRDITMASKAYVGTEIDTALANLSSMEVDGLVVTGPITTTTDGLTDIGSPVNRFRRVYSTATTAYYADLAENYVADAPYVPGTVLDFGGPFEVTIYGSYQSTRVAGVVSTNPAHLMNGHCEGEFVVPVALQGRVPTMVKGPVRKGDLMISAGDGFAIACLAPTPGSIIGKALVDFDGDEGIIEVVVGRC